MKKSIFTILAVLSIGIVNAQSISSQISTYRTGINSTINLRQSTVPKNSDFYTSYYGLSTITLASYNELKDSVTALRTALGSLTDTTVKGTSTLVSGTVTVTKSRCTTSSIVIVQPTSAAATTGINYKVVAGTGSFVVTAVTVAGATVTTDTSTIVYFLIP